MKVFAIVFHHKNGLIFSTDRQEDCWVLLFDKTYAHLVKKRDDSLYTKNGSTMIISELRQEHEIDPCLIVPIPNVLWHRQVALSVYQETISSLPPLEKICI